MSTAYLQLYLDIANRQLPLSLANSAQFTGLNNAFQYALINFRIYPVRPNGRITGSIYSVLDLDNLTIKMGIGAKAGSESLLAYTAPEDFTKVYDSGSAGPGYFSGSLDLNTTEMNAAISTAASISSFFEIQIGDSADYRTAYSSAITINATVMTGGAAAATPTPVEEYYTKAETSGLFVPRSGSETITLVSPDGTWHRILGVDNDGNAIDDLIEI